MNRRLNTVIFRLQTSVFMVLNYHQLYNVNVFIVHLMCKHIQAGTHITVGDIVLLMDWISPFGQ